MTKDEGRKLLEKYRSQMTAARQRNEAAFANFAEVDDGSVDLLGPTTNGASSRKWNRRKTMEKTIDTEVKTTAEGRALLEKYRSKMRAEANTFAKQVRMRTAQHAVPDRPPKQK